MVHLSETGPPLVLRSIVSIGGLTCPTGAHTLTASSRASKVCAIALFVPAAVDAAS